MGSGSLHLSFSRAQKVNPVISLKKIEIDLDKKEELEFNKVPLSGTAEKIFNTMKEMERLQEIVEEDDLLETLKTELDLGKENAIKTINLLLRKGEIYSPRPGYYKCEL